MSNDYLAKHTTLGQATENIYTYTPSLLCPIPRNVARQELGLEGLSLPFNGTDIWTAYEVSWLGQSGKPDSHPLASPHRLGAFAPASTESPKSAHRRRRINP